MILASFKRLFKTDYPEDQQALVEKLSESLNTAIEQLYELSRKKVSIRDNINCTVRDVDIVVNSAGVPTSYTNIKLDTPGRVEGVTVISAVNNDNTALIPTSQPFIAYQMQTTGITVSNVQGISTGTSWKLRVIIWQT